MMPARVEELEHNPIPTMPVEEVPAGEGAAIEAMITTLKAQLIERYQSKGKTVLRDAHPKHHGLVRASFIVDKECPFELRHGLFKEPRRFEALIRFSNSHPIVNHDLGKDLRGMAIKITRVPATLLGDHEQDFVMATGEAFFARDAVDFKDFPAASESSPKTVWYFVRGFRVRAALQLRKARKRPASPLEVDYFSQAPYRLGPHCVKFSVRPCQRRDTSDDPWYVRVGLRQLIGLAVNVCAWVGAAHRVIGYNALRASLARDLARGSVTLEFMVQRWPDLSRLPVWAIENATRRWTAPWVKVATIEIPQQHDIRDRDPLAERMSFNPWHALPDHQPLGSINRARLAIYREMAKFRSALNQGAPRP